MKRITYFFGIIAFLLTTPVKAQTFRDGLRAFQSGEVERAAVIFRSLAGGNNSNAQFMMGVMHEGGHGVDKNLTRAANWYLKAAKAGLSSAQFNLGIFFQFGKGMSKSAAQAFLWHSRAARQGHASAQNNLASLYFTGEGVAKDSVEAWKWYEIARRNLQGDAQSITLKNRDKVGQILSTEELTIAKRRAENFKPIQE